MTDVWKGRLLIVLPPLLLAAILILVVGFAYDWEWETGDQRDIARLQTQVAELQDRVQLLEDGAS